MTIDVVLTPAELPALAKRDLAQTACVVFDILRATSTFVTALQNGAAAIIPVSEITDALQIKKKQADVLIGGERHGVKIRAEGIDFDFGNSPREYTPEKTAGKTIVSTTTNGTRALRACAGANTVLASAFLNLSATAKFLRDKNFTNILLVCAGTGENAALEDILAAGALCQKLSSDQTTFTDSALIALATFDAAKGDVAAAASQSENARRLLGIPELRDDVKFCLQQDTLNFVAALKGDAIQILS
jgi:2-phosphosulfolactate phosphatase